MLPTVTAVMGTRNHEPYRLVIRSGVTTGRCGAPVWSAVAKPRRGADTALDGPRCKSHLGPLSHATGKSHNWDCQEGGLINRP